MGHQRKPDAGVAGRALDNSATRAKLSLGDGVADDEERGPVLDRLARIEELGLAENLAGGRFGRVAEADQRGVADRRDDIGKNHRRKLGVSALAFKAAFL